MRALLHHPSDPDVPYLICCIGDVFSAMECRSSNQCSHLGMVGMVGTGSGGGVGVSGGAGGGSADASARSQALTRAKMVPIRLLWTTHSGMCVLLGCWPVCSSCTFRTHHMVG